MTDKKYKNIFKQGAIDAALIAESIHAHRTKKEIGAHSIFLGQVRNDKINGKEVVSIEYTTYEKMALAQMHEIRESVFAKFPLNCMHVYHSIGNVAAGDISLFVFTSAPHRKAAIDACEELVERIKKELPVWGKEIMEDKSSEWKVNFTA